MIDKHYEAIAKIIGGTLHSSNRLKGLVKTFIEYFSSVDKDFNIEEFSKNALNGEYVEDIIEEPVQQAKPSTWAPKPVTVGNSQVDRINAEFEDAMKRMSTMIGKNYGKKQAKKTNN